MKDFIQKVENFHITVTQWITGTWSIIILRMVLESFSGNGLSLYLFLEVFVHPPLLFLSMNLALVIFIALYTKTSPINLLKISIFTFPILLSMPIVDFVASGGQGNIRSQYLFVPWPELLEKYVTFFGSNFTLGITYGVRLQLLLFILTTGAYLFYRTRKIWKTILGVVVGYTLFFIFTALPSIVGALSYLPRRPWEISEIEIAQRFIGTRSIFSIHYPPEKIQALFNIEMGLILFPILVIFLLVIFYLWDRTKWKEFFKHLRYLRLFFHLGALGVGMFLGMKILRVPFDTSLYGILTIISLVIAVTAIWVVSLTINDRNDIAIDEISNPERLLPRKIFTKDEFKSIGIIAALLAFFGTILVGYPFFMLGLASMILGFIYSSPPFRIRYWPFISHAYMALGTVFLVMMGFLLFAPSGTLNNFPVNFMALLVLVVTLIMNLKDIKDIEGDKPNAVYTIPTIFGLERSKTIIAILFFVSYLLFPLLLQAPQIFPTAIVFGLLTAFLIKMKKVHEGWIFTVYSLFVVVIALLVF